MLIKKKIFARVVFFTCLLPISLMAQNVGTLTGKVTDNAGKPVANAKVSAKSAATGESTNVVTDANGTYTIPGLVSGDYDVSASADGLSSNPIRVSLGADQQQRTDLTLNAAPSPQESLPSAPAAAPQQAPSSNAPASPSLSDLGFPPQQTQANAQLQATLARRTEMLKIHQRLGIITTIPMTAAVITGPMAKAKGKNGETIKEPTQTNLDVHAALGGLTTALYFTSAGYAILAPRVPGTEKHGAIRWHEALAFIHGPGMILTPILGYMAYQQENSGEKPHGIAAAHGAVAYTTAAAYGAAIVAVSWPIHWKFWEK